MTKPSTLQFTFKSGAVALCLLLITNAILALTITATSLGNLPTSVNEASGLDYNSRNSLWIHNDGVQNKLYKIGTTGLLKQTITVNGASGSDWEDLTHSEDHRYMFIGNFGNNNHDRRNLSIFRIPYPTSSVSSVTAQAIKFTYPDQASYPSKWKNFDAEAFFHLNGKLYVFTKGEGSAAGYTKMYKLPDVPGTYVASLVDSFYVNGRVTGASISPDGLTAVLITNTQVHVFRNFPSDNIFTGSYKKLTISGSWTQKEGVTFYTNSVIKIVDEGQPGKNKLYKIDLASVLPPLRMAAPVDEINNNESIATINAYPNPSNGYVNIETSEPYGKMELTIATNSGQVVGRFEYENPDRLIRIETDMLPTGLYVLIISGDNKKPISSLLSVMH